MQGSSSRGYSKPKIDETFSRDLRLWSGLVLFSFIITHVLNIGLGLISIEAMETGRVVLNSLWRSLPGTILLYGAFIIHAVLAMWALFRRRHFRVSLWEALLVITGLIIPILLAAHVTGTRLSSELFNTTDSYTVIVLIIWVYKPVLAVKQVMLMWIAWVHGCVALHYWLRLKAWYVRIFPVLLSAVILLPVLSFLGLTQAGKDLAALALEAGWGTRILNESIALSLQEKATIDSIGNMILWGFAASVAIVIIARAGRLVYERFRKSIVISYPSGKKVTVPEGFSVLEASLYAGIPHASACGGRGRCSTCRVRISKGLETLPSINAKERQVLNHIEAPPNVRLACQIKPENDLTVIPLLKQNSNVLENLDSAKGTDGREKEIVVLFADLRGFTRIAERKLPYDVVFLLNRYFEIVVEVIENSGGIANQFTGDGVMALFSVEVKPEKGCQQALTASVEMIRRLSDLSRDLEEELNEPLKIGIGIHTGSAVVGHMGHGVAMYLTAVGDTVHVASRLEGLTKDYDCRIVISDTVAKLAGIEVFNLPRYQLLVRNREEPIVIHAIKDIEEFAASLNFRW